MLMMEIWEGIFKDKIRYPYDLRLGYEMLQMLLKDGKQKEAVIALKRRIREISKKMASDELESENRILIEDCDYYVAKIALKAKSREEAEEEFRQEHYIEPYYSWHDCTGKPFTASHKVVKQRDKWFLVHHVSFDM